MLVWESDIEGEEYHEDRGSLSVPNSEPMDAIDAAWTAVVLVSLPLLFWMTRNALQMWGFIP